MTPIEGESENTNHYDYRTQHLEIINQPTPNSSIETPIHPMKLNWNNLVRKPIVKVKFLSPRGRDCELKSSNLSAARSSTPNPIQLTNDCTLPAAMLCKC